MSALLFLIPVVVVVLIVRFLWRKGAEAGEIINRGLRANIEMNERQKAEANARATDILKRIQEDGK